MCEPHASGTNRCVFCKAELASYLRRLPPAPRRVTLTINPGLPTESELETEAPWETCEGER